jgi:hypothetical protein
MDQLLLLLKEVTERQGPRTGFRCYCNSSSQIESYKRGLNMTRSIRLLMVLIVVIIAVPAASFGAVSVSITIAPPLLPVYSQPICPGAGYMWVPGYWAYGGYGYYWVPGTWVQAPFIGALWTPGYWGWGNGVYVWNEGYWGPQVGFYGGINYGFGYVGIGYSGGYWNNGSFYYNRTVNNVNTTIVRNVYSRTVINNTKTMNRVSYNGGSGGTRARPTAAESAAARDRRAGPAAAQRQLVRSASTNRAQLASVNHGRPTVLATPANRAAQNDGGPTHGTENPATASRSTVGERARNTAASRSAGVHNHAVSQRAIPRNNPEPRHTTPPPSHSSARNNAVSRPAAAHNHAVSQRVIPRNNPEPRHATPPPSHSSARSNAVSRPAAAHNHAVSQRVIPHNNPEPRHTTPSPSHYSAKNVQPHHDSEHTAQAHDRTTRP